MSLGALLMGAFGSAPTGPTVSLDTADVTRATASNPTFAGVTYLPTGVENANAIDGTANYTISRGSWLDTGSANDVWLERTINSGSLNASDPGAGRHQMNGARTLAVRDTTIPGGAVECNVTVRMYDASTGGNLLGTATFTLSATREPGA